MKPVLGMIVSAEGSFHGPSIEDFLPPQIFAGFNRINLLQIIVLVVAIVIFMLYAKRAKVVPGRAQFALEGLFDFVYVNICEGTIGKTLGRKYAPIIATIFFTVLFMNLTGIIPGMNIAASSRIALPIVLALLSYVTFIVAGIKEQGTGKFFKSQLLPPGAPKILYVLLTPIEFASTFIVRPATLVIRLLANMIAGHMLLALCLIGTETLLLYTESYALKSVGVLTFALAIFVTLFEVFVAALQAYVFAILSAAYINLSVHAH